MVKILCWLVSIVSLPVLVLVLLSIASRFQKPRLGSDHNRLGPCPDRPNSVCSEYPVSSSFARPIVFKGDPDDAWQRAVESITALGGVIILNEDHYLHAVFTSRFFRFIDDLELRQDRTNSVIHLRSAARAGYSDMGVNRKRIEALRSLYTGQ